MLIARVKIIDKQNEILNLFENIDWKRAFAIHLWYVQCLLLYLLFKNTVI